MLRLLMIAAVLTVVDPARAALDAGVWDVADLTDTWHPRVEVGGRWLDVEQLTMLEAVHERIQFAAEYPVRLVIVPGDAPSAFATIMERQPIIGINFAMLDAIGADDAQFAALIGHEIAHLKLEHGDKQQKRNIPKQVANSVVGGLIQNPIGSLLGRALVTAVDSTYSRKAERESDYLGAVWAVQAGYAAQGAVRLQDTLAAQGKKHPLPFLSSHPRTEDRMANLRALADRLSPGEPEIQQQTE